MYMGENYRFRMNPLRDFVYCTQFLQAEAMAYAYNCWRREFRGPGQENCAGVLVWQLNDIWPGVSWALIDVDMNPKPAYYITKRALSKTVVGAERIVTAKPHYITTGYPDEKSKLDVWAVNGELHERTVVLDLKAYGIESGKTVDWATPYEKKEYILKGNQTTELVAGIDIPNPNGTVVVAYLYDNLSGTMLARWVSWPEPLKFLQMSSELKVSANIVENGCAVVVKANAPAKGVVLSGTDGKGEPVIFDDNFIDLVPDEEIRVGIKGRAGDHVDVRFLYDWELEPGFEL
jgi:beta-mannosidase